MKKFILILILLLQTWIASSQLTYEKKTKDKYFAECILERKAYKTRNDSLVYVYKREVKKRKKQKKLGITIITILAAILIIK